MPIQAGFSQVDISPAPGATKSGWMIPIPLEIPLDPLHAKVALFRTPAVTLTFIQLDILLIRADDVADLRRRITHRYGIPGESVMVSTTHNHAGPAVADIGAVPRDDAYVERMIRRVVDAVGDAEAALQDAEIALGSAWEHRLTHNRRVVMRDGTTRTHSGYGHRDALYVEGPLDPEVGVLGARALSGEWLGGIVNFACHATHHGGDTVMSAGFPGAVGREMAARGCPVTLFQNGAGGNISPGDPYAPPEPDDDSMARMGAGIADAAIRALEGATWRREVTLEACSRTIALPLRPITEAELRGTTRGAQRFVDSSVYDNAMPALTATMRQKGVETAEVQLLGMDEWGFVAIPGELFVQLGLRIKEACHPRRVLVAAFTNGNIGYIPHQEAFQRGGFETTFSWSSYLAPEAGELLADAAIALVRET